MGNPLMAAVLRRCVGDPRSDDPASVRVVTKVHSMCGFLETGGVLEPIRALPRPSELWKRRLIMSRLEHVHQAPEAVRAQR